MGGWLAGLDAFVVGLAYLGALLAARFVLRPLLVTVLGQAPFVGGWLTSNIDRALGDFERAITPAAGASMGTLVSALDWLVAQVRGLLGRVADFAEVVELGLYNLGAVTIPGAISTAQGQLETLIEAARGFALAEVRALEARLGGEIALAEHSTEALVSTARADAMAEVSAAERIVLDEVRKAEQVTGQLFQQAEYDAAQAVAAAEAGVLSAVAAARQDLAGAVGAVEREVQQLGRAVGVAVADTTSVLSGDIQAAEERARAALAAAEAGLGATIDEVLKSGPWAGLVAAYEGGEAALRADVETLVREGLKAIRAEVADGQALRAKYGPAIQAEIERLRRAV